MRVIIAAAGTAGHINPGLAIANKIKKEEIEESNSLNLESGSAILIEQTTGKILYAHNIHEHPA